MITTISLGSMASSTLLSGSSARGLRRVTHGLGGHRLSAVPSLTNRTYSSSDILALEDKYGSFNYHPIPVVLAKGKGVHVWDVEGKEYIDFLSGYSAVNQGHCHPRLVKVMQQQAEQLTLVSRAFHSDKFGPYAKYICELLGYDRVLPMNTGVETGETALKLARRWAYEVKRVTPDQALMIYPSGNFWGRTLAAISSSDDPDSYGGYGPLMPGYLKVPYGDLKALEETLKLHGHRVAGFMMEPIQGEAGVVVPHEGYMKGAAELCKKYNVLLIADEVQTGLGRTGKMLCSHWDGVQPDIMLLGKALSGGMMPVSAILASHQVMLTIKPGQHGSTYGGNPLACVLATEALKVIVEENLSENAQARGEETRKRLGEMQASMPSVVKGVRGRGLLNALVIDEHAVDKNGRPLTAWDLCLGLKDAATRYGAPRGLLAKPTHGHIIRLAPPLVITKEQQVQALDTLEHVLREIVAGNRAAGDHGHH